jgi:hypothetical protein
MKRLFTDARFLTRFLVAGGLLLRVWHYAANHTIWYDESVLLVNVMEKDFAGLIGPLHHAVAAPPLFVWLLKLLHLTAGDVPYVWRAVPFAFSVAGLLVTVPMARRTLDPVAAVLAVGLMAVSDEAVWLGCCVKPYAGDAAIAAALLLYLRASDGWPAAKRLCLLAAVTPPLMCFSYTSLFVIGGLLQALAPTAWAGGTRSRLSWVLAGAVAGLTLAALYFGPMKAQRDPNLFIEWRFHFPNSEVPAWLPAGVRLPAWPVWATSGVFQLACNPSGVVLGLLAPLGAWGLWRAGRREVVIACVGMFVLALLAAAVKAYPYGQHRLSFFLTPAAIVLGAAGVGEIARRWKWVGVSLAVALVAVGDGYSLYHLAYPWLRPDAAAVRRHVQQNRLPGDVVLSDDATDPKRGNYLYFFFGELKPLAAGAEVPPGGRAWVVMDHYTAAERRAYIEQQLAPLGFELVEETQYGADSERFHQSAVYLYVRK